MRSKFAILSLATLIAVSLPVVAQPGAAAHDNDTEVLALADISAPIGATGGATVVAAADGFFYKVGALYSPAVDSFTRVQGLPSEVGIVQVDAGYFGAVVLGSDGLAYGVGLNSNSQLTGPGGVGASKDAFGVLEGLPGGVRAVDVSLSGSTSLVVGDDGVVYGSGSNSYGQLTGSDTHDVKTLTPLSGLPDGVSAIDATAAGANSLVIGDDDVVYGTGLNQSHAIGSGGRRSTLAPLPDLPEGVRPLSVSGSDLTTVVVGSDGKAYGLGSNSDSRLTGPASNYYSSMTPLHGLPSGVRAAAAHASYNHTLITGDDGVVYGTGYNDYGELTGPTDRRIEVLTPLAGMPDGIRAVATDAARQHTVVLGDDGVLYGTGRNYWGQLTGTGDRTSLGPMQLHGELLMTTRPQVSGTREVGNTLTIGPGSWSPAPDEVTYQWPDGSSNSTWTLPPNAVGTQVNIEVTAHRDGYTDATREINAGWISPGTSSAGSVSIIGRTRVGNVLHTRVDDNWNPSPSEYAYQWMRGNTPVAGATSASYRLRPGDLRHTIRVEVSATKPGYQPARALSNTSPTVRKSLMTQVRKPWVKGKRRVGRHLRARPRIGAVSPSPKRVKIVWHIGGDKLKKRTNKRRLPLKRWMRGKRVKVRFVYKSPAGYKNLRRTVKVKPRIR